MNHKRIYDEIIKNRQENPINEGYTEKHHIVPKSLGGSDNPDNLIKLSAREHFVCHYLLAKMYKKETIEWYKMNHAFMMMKCSSISHENGRYFNSRLYEALRGNFSSVMSLAQSGKGNSQYGTMWIYNLDLKESKKIPKGNDIPDGWLKGRKIKFDVKYNDCKYCGGKNLTRFIFCCAECKTKARKEVDCTYIASNSTREKQSKKMIEIRKTNKWISRK